MVIYCSKALQTSLKLTKDNMAQIETIQESDLYSWHGHIAKVDGRNTIVLINGSLIGKMMNQFKLTKHGSKIEG